MDSEKQVDACEAPNALPDSLEPPRPLGADPQPLEPGGARGLAIWLLLLLIFGVGGLLLRMEELSAMAAAAGLYVLSQAADIDERWRYLHYSVAWVVPFTGLTLAVAIAYQLFTQTELPAGLRQILMPALFVATLACAASFFRPVANALASALFRTEHPSHTLRLSARIVLVLLALALPAWFVLRSIFDQLFDSATPLIDKGSLEGQLIGYALLALATVGFLIRRNFRETMKRLGIGGVTPAQMAIVPLGVVALYGVNAGADWAQQTFLRDLWESDHHVNEMIAAGLGGGRIALLGVSAGIGEEVTLRGALQPKLGLVMTSLLFAALHLQYSWFGIGVIFVLGLILGIIRTRTNTTVAMAVHAVYDIIALMSV